MGYCNNENDGIQSQSQACPFSFKYPSEDDNSSILSGSNYDVQSSPMSNSQNTSQQFPGLTQAALEPILAEMEQVKESNRNLSETVTRLTGELEQCKVTAEDILVIARNKLCTM